MSSDMERDSALGTQDIVDRTDDPTVHDEEARPDMDRGDTDLEAERRAPDSEIDLREDETTPLLPDDGAQLRDEWERVQAAFVDDPRAAVQQADGLVADVIRQLATTFADERSRLEQQWDRGEDVDTEDLRVALQRYRSFFNRLLRV